MECMVHIFQAYKVEAKDFLVNDTSLLQEIEYDARQKSRVESKSGDS